MLLRDSLGRPLNRVEALEAMGILHLHLGMALAQVFGSLDVSKEGPYDHLNRLAVQCKLPAFGGFLQLITPRPLGMGHTSGLMCLHTDIPNLRRLHLGGFASLEVLVRQPVQLVDFYRIHEFNGSISDHSLQMGQTRYAHYLVAYDPVTPFFLFD